MNETLPNPKDDHNDPPPPDPAYRPAVDEPEFIGPYRIVGVLGSGGMGIVYKAEQREPIRRIVALKVIKAGMDTNEVIARFESERQALALMEHPCIARVLDAGATSQGRPYFVMEYVGGERITDYCDRQNLAIAQRLELFAEVCDAVQHAHTKAVIHRDLKPSNILVQLVDNRPVPKIIDFGIAKATNQRLTEKTLFTDLGQLIGTPEYMSPEQAEMSGAGVDTRSDIYSLGVVLYELLVGALPFDPKTLRAAAYAEIQRIIREVEPPRMSTRLSNLGEKATEIARHRRAAPGALESQVKGELEWIPQKAMRKDRTERYESARDLARDVRNYIAQKPLIAGPESALYKLRKFVRRNRARVAGGAVAASVVLATAIIAFILVTHQRNEARRARDEANIARAAESEANSRARRADRSARQVVFTYLTSVSQSGLLQYQVLAPLRRQFLQLAADTQAALASEQSGDPARRQDLAQSLNVLGEAQRLLGEIKPAAESLRKSIALRTVLVAESHGDAARQIDLAAATMNLGNALVSDEKYKEAIAQYTAAQAILTPLAATSIEAKSQAAQAHHNLAVAYDYSQDRAAAEREYQKAIDLRRQLVTVDPTSPRLIGELAQSLNALGKLIEPDRKTAAIALVAESAELRERLLQLQPDATSELRNLAESLGWLATLQFQLNDPAAPATNQRAAAKWLMLLDSPQHFGQPQEAVGAYNACCWAQLLSGDGAAAEASARRGLRLDSSDELLKINLAHALLRQSKDAEAKAIYLPFRGGSIEGIAAPDYLKADFDALEAAGALDARQAARALDWLRP